jgi:hypothetical protein
MFSCCALCLGPLANGCVNERTYVDADSSAYHDDGWDRDLGGTGTAALRGDVGELTALDSHSADMYVVKDERTLELSGSVPHQARPGSSVWLDVRIVNAQQLRLGQELRQEGTVDTFDVDETDGPQLDVYVCPNGEGVSGNADDIVVVRTGPETFTFTARSTNVEQNLDIDLDLATAGE